MSGAREEQRTRGDQGHLASSIHRLKPHYDVVVVGSGYGGAVTAARIAQARKSVCVLERGRELRPGDYPDTLRAAFREFQVDVPERHLLSPSALYDLRVNPDLSVFVGCGLGGTSLINANVALKPDDSIFTSAAWPERIRKEGDRGDLKQWFDKAKEMLEVQDEYPWKEKPRKRRLLDEIIPHAKSQDAPVAITVPRHDRDAGFRENGVHVMQHPCTGCGDCVSGCNYAAKNTLIMNYLPLAKQHGAEIFTETKVSSVESIGGEGERRRWRVHFELVGSGREKFGARPLFITAHTVILAGGVLGSTDILFRSKEEKCLSVSDQLGERFSGNGDVLAFSYNDRDPSNAIGFGARSPHGWEAPGPCISGCVEWPPNMPPAKRRILIQDGVIPGALSPILSLGFVLARFLAGRDSEKRSDVRAGSIWRLLDQCVRGGVSSTQTFLAMVDDPDYGRLVPEDGRIRVKWSDARRAPAYAELETLLGQAAARLGGVHVPSPFGPITVHPLGGCAMGGDAATGVVDHSGLVFKNDGGLHAGLYVCDASIIPRALRANPLLTITALAERAADLIGREM